MKKSLLTIYQTITTFNNPIKKSLENIEAKE